MPVVTVDGNNSPNTAYDLSQGLAVSYDPNVGDSSTTPHSSVYSSTEAGTTNWYVFTITTTTAVTFDIDGGMYDLDSWLNLYNSNMTIINQNDDYYFPQGNDPGSIHFYDSYMSMTLQPGTYYLQVNRYPYTSSFFTGQDYTLHFSAIPTDTTAPDAPTIAQTSPTSDTLPNLEGTAEAGATVTIRDSANNLVGTALADSSGNWAFELANPLLDGDYQFTATATDAAGNVSTAAAVTVSIVVAGNTINGGNGADTLTGTDGRDTINGGNGVDTINGGWAPDQLFGGNGDDWIYGGAGADNLFGENGSDRLFGDSGADTLDGGRGDDQLTGGAGRDNFVFGRSSGNDTVIDFDVGEDSFVLTDGMAILSLQSSGADTLVNLSSGAVITLQNVTITDSADLFAPPEVTATSSWTPSSDLLAI